MAVWSDNFMGGNGRNPPNDRIVNTGPFKEGDWTIVDQNGNDSGPLLRYFGEGIADFALPMPVDVEAALNESGYDESPWDQTSSNPGGDSGNFRNKLEGWDNPQDTELHNRVHVWVGGSMLPMTSPNDPVFFVHHCYVDREWDRWQRRYANLRDYPADGDITQGGQRIVGHNRKDLMYPWNTNDPNRNEKTVSNVLDNLQLGVAYDPGNHAIAAVTIDSANMVVFWIGPDGSVNCQFYINRNWQNPYQLAEPNSASVPSGSITAIYSGAYPGTTHLEVWWTRPDSQVVRMRLDRFPDGKWATWTLPFDCSTSSGLAVSYAGIYGPYVLYYSTDTSVYYGFWGSNGLEYHYLPSTSGGSTSSGLVAFSRIIDTNVSVMDVLYIAGDGSVNGMSYNPIGSKFTPYNIAGPGSAWGTSIAALSTSDGRYIDVFWIGPTNDRATFPYVQNGYLYGNSWESGKGWGGIYQLRSTKASIRGGLAAVARDYNTLDVFWIGLDGSVNGMTWGNNQWQPQYQVAPYSSDWSASTSGGLTAVARDSSNMDVFWIGDKGSVNRRSYINQSWEMNPYKFAGPGTNFPNFGASTGYPSDGAI
jgi:hypothetical protein